MEYKLEDGTVIEVQTKKTRKFQREYNKLLLDGATVSDDGTTKINAINADIAIDYLVSAMTGLKPDSIDALSTSDFDAIVTIINKESDMPGSSSSGKN